MPHKEVIGLLVFFGLALACLIVVMGLMFTNQTDAELRRTLPWLWLGVSVLFGVIGAGGYLVSRLLR